MILIHGLKAFLDRSGLSHCTLGELQQFSVKAVSGRQERDSSITLM
jgi:hypothetical protein